MINKINILGKSYTIERVVEYDSIMANRFTGYCDYDNRLITYIISDDDNNNLIHELIHAYLHESGMTKYANDETLVDFISDVLFKEINNMIKNTELI